MSFFIRFTMVLAVIAVAIVAGWLSYEHAYHVALAHGQTGWLARLYPVSIDGLVYCASMAILDAAHRGYDRPKLASWLLAVGIVVTAIANVWYGIRFGLSGAVISFWPAAALIGSYELLMAVWRSAAKANQFNPADFVEVGPPVADTETTAIVSPDKMRPGWNMNHYRAATQLQENPELRGKDFAPMIGVSERHARRILQEVKEAS
jgi:hypothetical protein